MEVDGGKTEGGGAYHLRSQSGSECITSIYILLSRIWLHGHAQLQGRKTENAVFVLCHVPRYNS